MITFMYLVSMLPLYRNENDRKKIYKLLDSSVTQQEK